MVHGHTHRHHSHDTPDAPTRDPVCGMTVDPAAGKPSAQHGGHIYHFCSASCREKFVKSPESYLEATDPVCGMKVDRSTARHFTRHEGTGYYFCSAGCQKKFEASPETYLGDRPAPEPMPAGTKYTCPMHPEIVRD
jgi:P-type Cu+ transporter